MMARYMARNEADSGLGPYLRDIRGDELLSADEERRLAEAIANGDGKARDRMVEPGELPVVRVEGDFV